MFDVEKIREEFPILHREVYGKPLVYLDSGATAQKPRTVIETVDRLHRELNANIHRGVHFLSEEATVLYEAARERIAAFVGAAEKEEIVFTAGATASLNTVAYAWGDAFVGAGDNILVSEMEHHSNIVPWQMLAERKGAEIRVLPFDEAGALRTDLLPSLVDERTRVVAVTQASNTLGTRPDLRTVVAAAHAVGAVVLQNSFQSFLATAEKPHFGLRVTVFAGLTNMVLDFLLVYVFPFGLLGAALATAFSQIVGALIPLVYFLRPNDSLLRLTRPRFDFRALGKACYNGSSEMVSNLSTSLVGVLYNVQLMAIAKENGVNAYGVLMYVSFIFMAFFFGYSIAVTPVVGYHYGAQNHAELKSLLKKSLTVTLITSLAMTASSILLANPIAHLFVGYDAELCDMTVNALRIYALSFLVCGFNIFGSAFFTGLNNGTASALISFLRTLVLQVVAVLLLPKLLGINGIWLAITVAEALTLIVTETLFLLGRKKYHYA